MLKFVTVILLVCCFSFGQYPNVINLINGGDDNMVNEGIAALPENGTLNILSGQWVSDSTIIVDKNINFVMSPGAWIEQISPGIAVDFQVDIVRKTIKVNVTRSTDWTAGNEGVKLRYTIGSDISINAIGFEKGLHLEADHGYLGYNRIYLSDLWSNRYGVYCNINGGSGVSRNLFIGGRISVDAAVNPALDRYGVFIQGGSTNYFIGCEIAVLPGSTGKAFPIFLNNSNSNQFNTGTIEGGTFALSAVGSSKNNRVNCVVGGIDSMLVYDISDNPGTNRITNSIDNSFPTEIFKHNPLARVSAQSFYGEHTPYYSVPGFIMLRKSTGVFYQKCGEVKINVTEFRMNSSYAIGRYVRTESVKDFLFEVDHSGNSGIIVVVPFDDTGAVMDTGVTQLSYNSGIYGGVFAGAIFNKQFFHVSEDVKSIWVGYEPNGYTDVINNISLKCAGVMPYSNPGYDLVSEGGYSLISGGVVSPVAPKGGYFNNGTSIMNLSPGVGDNPEWIITNRETKQSTDTSNAGDSVITVNSITGVSSGDIIGVILDNGSFNEWFWSEVQSVSGSEITMENVIPTGLTCQAGAKVITYKICVMAAVSEIVIK